MMVRSPRFPMHNAIHSESHIVSLGDGYNLPIRIDNNKGCPQPACAVDLGPNCPPQYKGPFNSDGFPVGCKSACVADPSTYDFYGSGGENSWLILKYSER